MADTKTTQPSSLLTPADLAARFHKVLSNPLRHEIVMRTGARPWSVSELAEATGRSTRHVYKAIAALKQEELIEVVATRPGPNGGAIRLYRAVSRFMVDADEWEELTPQKQAISTRKIAAELESDMHDGLDAGTFWGEHGHSLIRDHRRLDDKGMKRCDEILRRAYEEILDTEEESIERGETFLAVLGLTVFPAAPQTPSPRR